MRREEERVGEKTEERRKKGRGGSPLVSEAER